jgi:hypothetical protein
MLPFKTKQQPGSLSLNTISKPAGREQECVSIIITWLENLPSIRRRPERIPAIPSRFRYWHLARIALVARGSVSLFSPPFCIIQTSLSEKGIFEAAKIGKKGLLARDFGFRISDWGFRIGDLGFRIWDFGLADRYRGINLPNSQI